ncbi:metallophosphoesterase family protein [Furfurilactobacillus curtus]|uniref:Phosphoesterase n=1 Tax=Furfurilactobacillus curtus TaxID=1746200 RepID=A0ABQ5JKV6_9LACO
MKFIHTADLHLDSPFLGLSQLPASLWQTIYQSPMVALTRLVDEAIAEDVEFILITGDIYDRAERSISAQALFLKQMMRLQEAAIPVYLSYGNHDFLAGNQQSLSLPPNVQLFGPTVTAKKLMTKSQVRVQISGFSYANRAVVNDVVPDFPKRENGVDLAIGMLHGSLAGDQTHATYAPFTVSELLTKQYDYWALGHIHQRQILHEEHPWIIYPGNIQGRQIKETDAKGYYLVNVDQAGITPIFRPVAPIEWHRVFVTAHAQMSSAALMSAIFDRLAMLDQPSSHVQLQLIGVTIKQADQLAADTIERLMNGSLLTLIQAQSQLHGDTQGLNVVVRLEPIFASSATNVGDELDQTFWQIAAKQVFTDENLAQVAGQLFSEPEIAEALSQVSPTLPAAAKQIIKQTSEHTD